MKQDSSNSWEKGEISVYPDPCNGKLYLNTHSASVNLRIEIVDIAGMCIMNKKIEYDEVVIDLNHLDNGIYKIMIFLNERLYETKRIVKMNGHRN